jgi:WD40 repeat protein
LWRLPERPDSAPRCRCEIPPKSADTPQIGFVAISRDESRFVLGYDRGAELWSSSGRHLGSLVGENDEDVDARETRIVTAAFHPDGDAVVTAAVNGMVWLWSADGAPRGSFVADHASPDRIFDLAVDPLGDYLRQIGVLAGPRGTRPDDVVVSPDGEKVAPCFSNGVVRIWSLREQRRTMTFDVGPPGPILFTADSRRLLHATPSGPIEQHALDVADLFASAAARAARELTADDELARFGIPQPPRLDVESFR